MDKVTTSFSGSFSCPSPLRGGVTAFWASPRFGHPHSQIPSVLGIPSQKKCWISRENGKRFRDGFR